MAYCQNKTLKIPVKALPRLSLISVLGCCATPILLFCSYQFIPSGTATVINFTYPAFVVVGGIVFLKNKPQLGSIVCVALCVVGIGMFYSPGQAVNLTGVLLSLGSAITFAAYVNILACFDRDKAPGFLLTFYIVLISSIVSFAVCVVTNSLALPTTLPGWGLCLLFSLLVTVGAVVLFQESAFLIGGERTSILSTLEPITSLIIGAIVFHEVITLPVIIGSILVIAASLITVLPDLIKNKEKA